MACTSCQHAQLNPRLSQLHLNLQHTFLRLRSRQHRRSTVSHLSCQKLCPLSLKHRHRSASLLGVCSSAPPRRRAPDATLSDAEPSTPFLKHLRQQALAAAGAMLLLALLFRPFGSHLQQKARYVTADSTPAGVWLPRPQAVEGVSREQQRWHAAAYFASSSVTATSSRLLRVSDAFLMQMTVTLQQVAAPCLCIMPTERACAWHMHSHPVAQIRAIC